MVTRRTRLRPWPLLLLWCLLGLQWTAPAAAQTSSPVSQTSSPAASQPPPQSADRMAGLTWALEDMDRALHDLETGRLQLTTVEREVLCRAFISRRSPGDSEVSDRSRRSSERSPQQRLTVRGGGGGGAVVVPPGGCPFTWDNVLCWPATDAGRNRSLPCFHEFNGILYHTNGQASWACQSDGEWANSTDYSACLPLPISHPCTPQDHPASASIEATSVIYLTGYSASLVALVAATAIFRHFKELHCPRNIIHTNLFVACMVTDALWITVMAIKWLYGSLVGGVCLTPATRSSPIQLAMAGTTPTSCGLVILLQYFHVATFFWMFVEGLNLYMMVVETFRVDRIRLYLYPLIGWGLPLLAVTAWSVVRAFTAGFPPVAVLSLNQSCSLVGGGGNLSFVRGLEPPLEQTFFMHCPWLEASVWDWIHLAPSLLVLAFNVVFLAKIMHVLITKLRSTNCAETQQYKKATKALLVLMPLLGVTYILVLVSPSTSHPIYYIQAVLVSTQGLVVSLLYCFCNAEVQLTLRKHWCRRRGQTYLSPADAHRSRLDAGTSHLRATGDSSATDVTYAMAMESDPV